VNVSGPYVETGINEAMSCKSDVRREVGEEVRGAKHSTYSNRDGGKSPSDSIIS
jgi:hypothetical protein